MILRKLSESELSKLFTPWLERKYLLHFNVITKWMKRGDRYSICWRLSSIFFSLHFLTDACSMFSWPCASSFDLLTNHYSSVSVLERSWSLRRGPMLILSRSKGWRNVVNWTPWLGTVSSEGNVEAVAKSYCARLVRKIPTRPIRSSPSQLKKLSVESK